MVRYITIISILLWGCGNTTLTKSPPVTPKVNEVYCVSGIYKKNPVYFCTQHYWLCGKVQNIGERHGSKISIDNVSDCGKMKLGK